MLNIRLPPPPSLYISFVLNRCAGEVKVANNENSDQRSDVMGVVQRESAALGGHTQQETADEAAGQHDVPLDKVRGLRRRDGATTELNALVRERGKF